MEYNQRNMPSLRDRTLNVYSNQTSQGPPSNFDVNSRMEHFTNYGPNNQKLNGTQLNNRQAMQIFISEFMGTAIIMFMSGMFNCSIEFLGLGYIVALQIFGHISGGHFNPAVTIGAVIMQKTQYILIPFYIISQIVGAIVGVGLVQVLIFDSFDKDLTCPTGNKELSEVQGMFIEFLMTCFLVLAYCVLWDNRSHNHYDTAPLKIGFMIIGMGLATASYTNLKTNSAFALAPLVFAGEFTNHWIYWVGPNLGGAFAGVLYKFLLEKRTWQFE